MNRDLSGTKIVITEIIVELAPTTYARVSFPPKHGA